MTECIHCSETESTVGDLCDSCQIWLEDTDGYYDDTHTADREEAMRDD